MATTDTGGNAAFPYTMPPVSNVPGFTYRDGATYLEILYGLRDYILNTIEPGMNAALAQTLAEFQTGIANAEKTITDQGTSWQTRYDALSANFTAAVQALSAQAIDNEITDSSTASHAAILGMITTAITAETATQNAYTDTAVAGAHTYTDTAVAAAETVLRGETAATFAQTIAQWKPNTVYTAGQQAFSPAGEVVSAYENHTSGTSYNPANWYAEHGYLFANFTYNSPEGEKLNLFYSGDGVTVAGHGPNPVYSPPTGLRDPSVIRVGGTWFMAYGFHDPSQKKFAVASSPDLLNWRLVTTLDVSNASNITNAWAPELTVDTDGSVYAVFTNVTSTGTLELWYVKAADQTLANWGGPVKLSWTNQPVKAMDATFTRVNGTWYMFYGDNNYICRATAPSLLGPWTTDRSGDWAGWGINREAPELVRLAPNKWRLYIDRYDGTSPDWTYPGYAYTESTDLSTWGPLTPLTMGPDSQGIVLRHGSFVKLPDKAAAQQVQQVMLAGPGAQRYLEVTATSLASGVETNVGTLTVDTDRSLVTDGFTFPAPGQIKIEATGVYAIHFHAGEGANNFGNGSTPYWVTIFSPTLGNRNRARAIGYGGYEVSAEASNVRCNAGEIFEFRLAQFSGASQTINSRISITRLK